MALGGGAFTAHNKSLPGAYINFVSRTQPAGAGERGYAAIGIELDWGPSDLFTVTAEKAVNASQELFGYSYDSDNLMPVRELFRHATNVTFYRLNGDGAKATSTGATALYTGTRGNDLRVKIAADVDDTSKFVVTTLLDNSVVDTQTVRSISELKDNSFVTFTRKDLTAGEEQLSGGTNGTATGNSHDAFLKALEAEAPVYNTLGCNSSDNKVKAVYVKFIKRMRDQAGIKAQLVVLDYAADYEGVINVADTVKEGGGSLIYWMTGASAGCALSASLTNMTYDGEYTLNAAATQAALISSIEAGEFRFHKVGTEIRTRKDQNSIVTLTDHKTSVCKNNETIRVIDDIATQIATIFNNRYLGKVKNNDTGRALLKADIVRYHKELEALQAIEPLDTDKLLVREGEHKGDVVISEEITVNASMEKLYMEVVVG